MPTVIATRQDNILMLALNRPEARNALNSELCGELLAYLRQAQADDEIRALVLTGTEDIFCAGGDLGEVASLTPIELRGFLNDGVRQIVHLIQTMNKPVLAALNGPVAGAGIGLALACDIVVACEEAAMVIAFGKVGLIPDAGIMQLLVQNIGLLRAKEIVLGCEPIAAERAAEMGLYNLVVPEGQFDSAVAGWAERLANGPTLSMGMAKNLMREAARMPYDAFMDLESNSQSLVKTSADHAEGINAFKEKRPPRFTGQ
ncbi:MAG: enoyl-CoA hydratase-related protein [Immundisolibacteraceae bacterium]|nr:enoyl-CoA hydratase-related protein [Immundisolibacteraceae bacterium]